MTISASELEAFARLPTETLLLRVLVQLAVLILFSRLVAALLRRMGQPNVVGEIAAGLMLGPSLFGWLLPDLSQALFRPAFEGVPHELSDPALAKIFAVLSQLGLIFLLFQVGMEFDFGHLKDSGKAALAVATAGLLLPFALGLAISPVLLPRLEEIAPGRPVPALGFTLFLGVALSITALPVLGRMMMEWNITRTRLGSLTIAAAAIEDAIGWMMLASIAAVVRGEFEMESTLRRLGLSAAFVLVMMFAVRPVAVRWARAALRRGGGEIGLTDLAILLATLLAAAVTGTLAGLFDVFGAFLLGAILSGEAEFRDAVARRLRDLVAAFFLPIFFTYTGLRTDVRSLGSAEMWLAGGLVIVVAVFGKLAGCGLAAWAAGLPRRESACVGAMMNTRGLMELIVINLGYELRVIPRSVYCMLVLMALATTVMTTPLLRRLARGTELEEPIRRSGFFGDAAGAGDSALTPGGKPTGQGPADRV